MRSRTFLLSTLALASLGLKAQWAIGPKAGITLAHVRDTKNDVSTDGKLGLAGGISAQIGTGTFRFQPEILFAQKGYRMDEKFNFFGSSSRAEVKFTVNYLEVPLMATVVLGNRKEKLLLQAGPYVAAALGARSWARISNNGQATESSQTGSPDDFGVAGMDMGFNFGMGMAIPISDATLTVEARYQLGLADVADGSGAENKNRGAMFTVGYLLPMGKKASAPANAPKG